MAICSAGLQGLRRHRSAGYGSRFPTKRAFITETWIMCFQDAWLMGNCLWVFGYIIISQKLPEQGRLIRFQWSSHCWPFLNGAALCVRGCPSMPMVSTHQMLPTSSSPSFPVSTTKKLSLVGYCSQVTTNTLGIMRVLIDSLNSFHNPKNVWKRLWRVLVTYKKNWAFCFRILTCLFQVTYNSHNDNAEM